MSGGGACCSTRSPARALVLGFRLRHGQLVEHVARFEDVENLVKAEVGEVVQIAQVEEPLLVHTQKNLLRLLEVGLWVCRLHRRLHQSTAGNDENVPGVVALVADLSFGYRRELLGCLMFPVSFSATSAQQ